MKCVIFIVKLKKSESLYFMINTKKDQLSTKTIVFGNMRMPNHEKFISEKLVSTWSVRITDKINVVKKKLFNVK